MSTFTEAPFGEIAPLLADLGYHPVPIPAGQKGPRVADWQAPRAPSHYLPRWFDAGTGILAKSCPALDVDVRDRALVRALVDLAGEVLGGSPFRVGSPPKVLLPFATVLPFAKLAGSWWAVPGDDWRAPGYAPHRVEILCDGQQFFAYGRHPRGTFYRWGRGEPMQAHRVDLPEIDQASAARFVQAAETVFEAAGAIRLTRVAGVWSPAPKVELSEAPRPRGRQYGHAGAAGGGYRTWQTLDPETLAKRIDPERARRTSSGWITSCPAHRSEGHRSLAVNPRSGGGSVVHCFGECDFRDVSAAIEGIV